MPISPDTLIPRIPGWEKVDYKIEFLAGGITNHNYRVEVNDEFFVLRITGENTELLGINRHQEYAANRAAAEINVAPQVIYFIEPEGYLVTRFITGKPISPEDMRQTTNIQRIADILKRIHTLPAIDAEFSPFRTVKTYYETAKKYTVTFPNDFNKYLEAMREIESAFLKKPFKPSLCHNDLLNENFLDDGNIRILDWEYAGMGDSYFDLANFAVHHQFTAVEDRLLLEAYFATATAAQIAKLNLMKIMSDFREAMWGMMQLGISTLDFDFRDYADQHFKRMSEQIDNPQRKEWLGELNNG